VKKYIETSNFEECMNIQSDILQTYITDFHKYARKSQIKYLAKVFNSIPYQLGQKFKYSNVDNTTIVFKRKKIKRTTKTHSKTIVISIIPKIKTLIDKWGTKPEDKENYILDIIKGDKTEEEKRKLIKNASKNYDKCLKRIGEELQLSTKLTMVVARYTRATVMMILGASENLIGEELGHHDIGTTKRYLGSFENNIKKQFQNKLTDFD